MPAGTQAEAFSRLRSIQFDPIAPVGCNHDLVLQARLPGYKVGDWEKIAYEDRLIYDGWDKQASLVPFEGWPLRRHIHKVHRNGQRIKVIFDEHPEAVDAILKEIERRGPLMPKDCEFQGRKDEWKGSWLGPNLAKLAMRALWHAGVIMTSGRRGGQHVYDLAERIVPPQVYNQPMLSDADAQRELALERHRQMGILRPAAGPEIWSYSVMYYIKRRLIQELLDTGAVVGVDVEGMRANATPEFLALLDQPSLKPRVTFVGPLDQLMWDRKMVQQIFDYDYVWEIYTPEAKRRWGYYVLPVLFGDTLVARAEFFCREGVLELRQWHFELGDLDPRFMTELEVSLRNFMDYCSARSIRVEPHIDARVRSLAMSLGSD